MRAKLWIKVVGGLGVVFVAAAVASVSMLSSMDFNRFKSDVEKLAEDATGRELTIKGDMQLDISLSPSLNVSGVTMAGAAWGEDKPMLVLNNLQAKVDLVSLLSGQIDVDYIVMDGLALVLQTDGKGRANWEFESPGAPETKTAGGLSFSPRVRDVRLKNVDLTYMDGATGGRFNVLLGNVDLQAESFTSPINAVIDAAYKGVNLTARAELGSMQHLIGTEGGSFPVNMTIGAPGVDVTVIGGVEQPSAGMTVEARVTAAVTDMFTLAKLAGMDLANIGRLDARLTVKGAGTAYDISGIEVKADTSDVTGNLKIDLSGKRPHLSGRLKSKLLDVDQLAGLDMPKAMGAAYSGVQVSKIATQPPAGEAKALFSNVAFPITPLYSADLDLSVRAAKVVLRTLTLSSVGADVALNGGRLVLGGVKLTVEDGSLSGNFVFNGRGKVPSASAKATVRGLDLGTVLVAAGQGRMLTLKINSDVDVTSGGASVQALMAGLNGHFSFSGRDGRIEDKTIIDLTSGLGSAMPWGTHEDGSIISCALGRLPVKNGVMTAETVLADTPDIGVRVTGNIDLGGERLHLTIIPQAKTTSLASFAVPVRVKGALSAPYVDVDPKDAVVGTVGNIVKAPVGILIDILGGATGGNATNAKDDPCLTGLSGGKTLPSQTEPVTEPQAKPNAIKDIGKAFKGLFGQ